MQPVSFHIVPYEDGKGDMLAIRNSARDSVRDGLYFNWRYTGRPNLARPVLVFAQHGVRKIGALSVIPHHFSVNGESRVLGILGDISVADEARGKGIATGMFQFLSGLKETAALGGCVVLPNEEAARPLEKSGWSIASGLERYVRVLRTEAYLEKKLGSGLLARGAALPLNLVLGLAFSGFMSGSSNLRGETATGFDSRFDGLWKEFSRRSGMNLAQRDASYLSWRYGRHPSARHNIFTLSDGERLCGYAVYRMDGACCYIDDILCIDEKRYPAHLLFYFTEHIRKDKMCSSVILAMSRNGASIFPLAKFGFLRRPGRQKFMVLPAQGSGLSAPLRTGNWYLTQGDKDV